MLFSTVLVGTLPVYGRQKENNPAKIGRRDVAHRSIISLEKERAVGRQEARYFESRVELDHDPAVQQYITAIAGRVVTHSDWKAPITIRVIKSSAWNSFSLPGGIIYLSSGLLLAAQDEHEIAGVIAHQVAHAAARHWASDRTRMILLGYAMGPVIPSTPPSSAVLWPLRPPLSDVEICSGYGGQPRISTAFSEFGRQNELEADYLGLQYVYKAGYDPSAYVALLARLAPKGAAASHSDIFSATPPVAQRVAKAEKEIHKILPNASPPKSSPEFLLMKSRL